MKRILMVAAVLLMSAGAASAATTQKWTAGWDNFSEPLNYTKSNVKWSVNSTTRKLTVTFTLVGANPNKIYQASIHIFCTTIVPTFGQFPTEVNNPPNCTTATKQGVTASIAAVEFGVVTTDLHGNGKFTVVVGPIASGTYNLEFTMRNGVGCGVIGGAGNNQCYDDCSADFQSPGPTFGDATTITIP
jgi:hypothetical protein